MKKMLKRRSGFTLVELLIVIIIIGILAGAMLMLVGSGTDRAEATKIISDLRSLKAASLMYYADNPGATGQFTGAIASLEPYMDKELDNTEYDFAGTATGEWYVGFKNVPGGGTGGGSGAAKILADNTEIDFFKNATSADEYAGEVTIYVRSR